MVRRGIDLATCFPERAASGCLVGGQAAFDAIFDPLPALPWQRVGSWIEAWDHDRRIAFSPHQRYASLYFEDDQAVPAYRELGGTCPTGRFTINLPYGTPSWDPEPIRFLVSRILGLESLLAQWRSRHNR